MDAQLGSNVFDHRLIAAFFGFRGVAGTATSIAKMLFFLFVTLSLFRCCSTASPTQRLCPWAKTNPNPNTKEREKFPLFW